MMDAAERDREFVAGLAAERPRLHEAQMVRVRRLAAADEARLSGDISQVLPVAVAARGGDRENALVDALGRMDFRRFRCLPVSSRAPTAACRPATHHRPTRTFG